MVAETKSLNEQILTLPPQWQSIFDSVVDGFTITDLEGNILYVNEALVKMYGYASKEEVVGRSSLEFISGRDRKRASENIRKTLEDSQLRRVEYVSVRKDGSEFPIELSVGVIKNPDGQPVGFVGITKDVTQRRRTEDTLMQTLDDIRESEAKLTAVFNSNQIAIVIFDKYGVIQRFNRSADEYVRKILGKKLKTGEAWYEFLPPRFQKNARERIQEVMEGHSVRFDYRIKDPTGRTYWFDVSYQPIQLEDGEIVGISLLALDITDRIKYEEGLKKSQEQLLILAKNLQAIQERERSRIAMDIHDDLGQKLSLLQIEIDLLAQKAAKSGKTFSAELAALSNHVQNVIEDIKRIAHELHPAIRSREDLITLLKWKTSEIQRSTGLKIDLMSSGCAEEIDPEVATALYRIACEALTNVIRHARASRVWIELKCDSHTVFLTVRDNGIGIAPDKIKQPDSYGLLGMFARAQALNGSVKIEGDPGRGTTIQIAMPLKKEERESR